MNHFHRMLPMTLLSLIGFGVAAIPALGNIAPVIAVVGIGLLIYSLVKLYHSSKEKNRQFMIDYIYSQCGNFLGYIPYKKEQSKNTQPPVMWAGLMTKKY